MARRKQSPSHEAVRAVAATIRFAYPRAALARSRPGSPYEIIAGAFKPLSCVAKMANLGARIDYEVTNGKKILVKDSVPSGALAQKDYNLRNTIMRARRTV
jgi:hypothetical protein